MAKKKVRRTTKKPQLQQPQVEQPDGILKTAGTLVRAAGAAVEDIAGAVGSAMSSPVDGIVEAFNAGATPAPKKAK